MPLDGVLPADCVGGELEFLLYKRRVYVCPTALSTAVGRNMPIESDVMRGRYLDRLMSIDRFNQPLCRVCCANRNIRHRTGSCPI